MSRSFVGIGLVFVLILGIGAPAAAQPGQREPWPLQVTLADVLGSRTVCQVGPGWCGDGKVYTGDSRNKNIAEIQEHQQTLEDATGVRVVTEGGFSFQLTTSTGRAMTFDFSRPIPPFVPPPGYPGAKPWCPERCPAEPEEPLPNFQTDPIKVVNIHDLSLWSTPNYDFYTNSCDTGLMPDDRCATDMLVKIQTGRQEYRLRFSPNIWRVLTRINDPTVPGQTSPYGVVGVKEVQVGRKWELTPLLQHLRVIDREPESPGYNQVATELCPVVFEHKTTVQGRNVWKFLGCYDMPFTMTLTRIP